MMTTFHYEMNKEHYQSLGLTEPDHLYFTVPCALCPPIANNT